MLLHGALQGVVIGVKPRGKDVDGVVAEERSDSVQQLRGSASDWCRDASRHVGQGLRFIYINNTNQVGAFVSEVAGVHKPFVPDFTLYVQAPFLDVGLPPIGLLYGERRRREIHVHNHAARIV